MQNLVLKTFTILSCAFGNKTVNITASVFPHFRIESSCSVKINEGDLTGWSLSKISYFKDTVKMDYVTLDVKFIYQHIN